MTSRIFTTEDASIFLADLNNGGIRRELQHDSYGECYRALIKLAAASSDDPQNDAARSLACAVYGWMPTIIDHFEIEGLSIAPLREIREINSWEDGRSFLLRIHDVAPVNRSWVGTSKFMHFLNPAIFPIWDSRVAVSFHSKMAEKAKAAANRDEKFWPLHLNHFCNRKDHYLEYMKFMIDSVKSSSDWVDEMQKKLQMKDKHLPTKLRCLELTFFNRYSSTVILEKEYSVDH